MKLAYIIPGHGLKAHGQYDPGASGNGLTEATSVRVLAAQLRRALAARGVEAVIDDAGPYSERHVRAAELLARAPAGSPMAVIHLHHNAGPASARYALAMHDRRSRGGAALAEALALPLGALSGFEGCRVVAVYDDRPAAGAWLHRAFGCIDEVYAMPAAASAALIEAGFISNEATARWFSAGPGYTLTADAIAIGAAAWLQQRAAQLAA